MTQEELIEKTCKAIDDIAKIAKQNLNDSIDDGTFRMDIEREDTGTYRAPKALASVLVYGVLNLNNRQVSACSRSYQREISKLKKSIRL